MQNEHEGYGVFLNTESGEMYHVAMKERNYERDSQQGQIGTEAVKFVPFIRNKGSRGKADDVDRKATLAKVEAVKKEYRAKRRKMLAKAS